MKNKDILDLWNGLNRLSNKNHTVFSYAVLRNKKLIKDIIESIKTVQSKKLTGQDEYEKERSVICEKYAEKDEAGKPIVSYKNGVKVYNIIDRCSYITELKDILQNHKQYTDALIERQKELEYILNMPVDLDLVKLKVSELPRDLTEVEISSIELIISES